MTVRTETRRVFVATRTVPRSEWCSETDSFEDAGEWQQTRRFLSEHSAWLWVARGALFLARSARCRCKSLQAQWEANSDYEGPARCKLCDEERWRPVVGRLARILRSKAKAGAR